MRPSFFIRWFWRLSCVAAALGLVYLFWLPPVSILRRENPRTTAILELRRRQASRKGVRLRSVMIWRSLGQISPDLIHAVLLDEDDTFYQHAGFDFEQIRIALQRDWKRKRFAYGGSTLTQQLARTLYLSPHKDLLRKAKEALIAIELERTLSKRRILELYLNVVEWGKGIYGAEAAARHYFGVGADALSADQAIALASILPSPRRWSPFSERAFMARRRMQLARRMQEAGYLPIEVSTEAPAGLPLEGSGDWIDGAHDAAPLSP